MVAINCLLISPFLPILAFALPSITNLNPTGAGCVDPAGYLSCYDTQLKQLTGCAQAANATCTSTTAQYQTCMAGCNGAYLASKVGCWLQSCWNRVYSCEFQQTAAEYVVEVGLVQGSVRIPFYPPPDGQLPGGCSCNLGHAVGNFTDTPTYHCMPAAQTGNDQIFAECTCCDSVIPISNALNACPNTDLKIIGFANRLQSVQNTMSKQTRNQCAVLDGEGMESAAYCAANYGVTELAGPKIYNALKLPAGKPGTEPLSNNPGTAFTSFTSVLTLALDPGYKSTITPAPYNQKNAEQTSAAGSGSVKSGDAANTASGSPRSTSGSVTGTGSAPASTTRSSGERLGSSGKMLWSLGLGALIVMH